MNVVRTIREALVRALGEAGVSVQASEVGLEHPADFKNGDYSSNAALTYAKRIKLPPLALAEKILASLGEIPGAARIEIAGPGFINFHLAASMLNETIKQAIAKPDAWGKNDSQKGKHVMVEYTDPNPFKEFHIGHLMSNAIGESISRLIENQGAKVKRANYQGDVGLHVAKAVAAYSFQPYEEEFGNLDRFGGSLKDKARLLGQMYAYGDLNYNSEPGGIKDLVDQINKEIYSGNMNAMVSYVYERGCQWSLDYFEEIYKKLGTEFDKNCYFFESNTGSFGKKVVEEYPKVFEKSDGAVVYKGDESKGLHTRVFINSEGLPTYEAKELGLAKMKYDTYPYDTSIVITGNEVNEYFRVLLDAMSKVYPELASKTIHVSHGMMRFAEGKMSSRTGNVISGESLLNELIEVAKVRAAESRADNPAKLAQQVAVAAVKYQILKQGSEKDIIFDRERALSLEGDSGPYLQYAHARAAQVVAKAREQKITPAMDVNTEPAELTRFLHRFPEIVEYSARELEPHLLTTYLTELAGMFNSWYSRVHILDGSENSPHKVALAQAVQITLKNGLCLLGIPAPEKM